MSLAWRAAALDRRPFRRSLRNPRLVRSWFSRQAVVFAAVLLDTLLGLTEENAHELAAAPAGALSAKADTSSADPNRTCGRGRVISCSSPAPGPLRNHAAGLWTSVRPVCPARGAGTAQAMARAAILDVD